MAIGFRSFFLLLHFFLTCQICIPTAWGSTEQFRLGFSSETFNNINENDAKAAIKIWGELIGKEKSIPIDPNSIIFENQNEIVQAMQNASVDAVGITTLEYFHLKQKIEFSHLFVTSLDGSVTVTFVLLAHRQGKIKKLADLSGKSLIIHDNVRALLAQVWLDNQLKRHGLNITTSTAQKVLHSSKLAKVILPVFFQQIDGCLVTRNGFEVMAELNPQLAQDLIIIDESIPLTTGMFAFRKNYNPPFFTKLLKGLTDLNKSTAGLQILNIFQSDGIEEVSSTLLLPALDLIREHERLSP